MKTLKYVPERSEGLPGDHVKVGTREYLKSSNGKWGLVVTKQLLKEAKYLYCDEGLNLREAASSLSLKGHPAISHSLVQRLANQNGWMRSHYGRTDNYSKVLADNRNKIVILYDAHAFTLREIAYVTGTHITAVTSFFRSVLNRPHFTGRRPDAERRRAIGVLDNYQSRTWNLLLALDFTNATFDEYKKAVRQLSNFVYQMYALEHHKMRSISRHVDHIFSIYDGYWTMRQGKVVKRRQVVPLNLICHSANLRLVDAYINLKKGDTSHLTEDALIKKVKMSKIQIVPINRRRDIIAIASSLKLKGVDRHG